MESKGNARPEEGSGRASASWLVRRRYGLFTVMVVPSLSPSGSWFDDSS
jgi:hypothetical protein